MSFVGVVELLAELIVKEANCKRGTALSHYYDDVRYGVERTLDKLGIHYEYEDTEDENYPLGIKKIIIHDAEFCTTEKELKPLNEGSRKYED